VASAVTHTSRFEKVVESLTRYCLYDYYSRGSDTPGEAVEYEFYRDRYGERLDSLTEDLVDHRSIEALQAYFAGRGAAYEVWEGTDGPVYMLAPVLEGGRHTAGLPVVSFDYRILGEKWILPWKELQGGIGAADFVSVADGKVYVHRDSLEPILDFYFEVLWTSEVTGPGDLHSIGWNLSFLLALDLDWLCENVFIYRHYRDRKTARAYFLEQGFDVFLPTMLAMAARMVADGDGSLSAKARYQRAYLTGLYVEPNYTMVGLLVDRSEDDPWAGELWRLFIGRLKTTHIRRVSLDEISLAARDILDYLEGPVGP
jgi:hypothetical protein